MKNDIRKEIDKLKRLGFSVGESLDGPIPFIIVSPLS